MVRRWGEVGWISIMMARYGERGYMMRLMDGYLYGGLADALFQKERAEKLPTGAYSGE